MNTNTKIGIALGLAGVGFIAYKKGVFKNIHVEKFLTPLGLKSKMSEQEIANAQKAEARQVAASTTAIQNPNSLKALIAIIQLDLAVSPDGIIGKNTIAALRAKYPNVDPSKPEQLIKLATWIRGGKSAMAY
jgi:hypothetical protein